MRAGAPVYGAVSLTETRERTLAQLAAFGTRVTRFLNPHRYPVGLESSVHDLRTGLILSAREQGGSP